MRYAIVIEKTATGFSAYSPDVEGCGATGATRREVEQRLKDALVFHLEELRLERRAVPRARTHVQYLELEIPAPA